MIAAMQSLWDSTDAETFLPFHSDGLEGMVHPFEMLYLTSMNDFQVSTLSCDRAGRTAGLSNLEASAWHPWGIELDSGPFSGSGVVYFDGGFPALYVRITPHVLITLFVLDAMMREWGMMCL